MEKGKIIILNGVSSSGKTTLAKSFQNKLSTAYYHICSDDFMHMTPRQILFDDFENQLLITHSIMRGTITLFSNKGYNAIVDDVILNVQDDLPDNKFYGIYKNDSLYEYVTAFKNYPVLFIHVDCPIEELEKREKERGDRYIGQARCNLEHMDFNIPYDLEVNTFENTAEECADKIIAMLNIQEEWHAFKTIKERFDEERLF